ncbi:hypothetical protein XENORESO_014581 [Xenotaenia resolanae]|uniref:Uncharacterized protein n=1 Tax=Xenotaenia resolanae TaxID=208358 RepID=A0ABV0VZ85_9TELE
MGGCGSAWEFGWGWANISSLDGFIISATLLCSSECTIFHQQNSGQQLETPSTAAARINRSTDEDSLYYTSVVFSKTQDEPLYSNFMPAEAKTPQEEEVDVEYSTVMIRGTSSIGSHDASEESCALYSTVSKVNGLQTLHL